MEVKNASKIYRLKQKVLENLPPTEMPWTIFGRLMVKTGIIWSKVDETTEVTPEQMVKALDAVESLLGKRIEV